MRHCTAHSAHSAPCAARIAWRMPIGGGGAFVVMGEVFTTINGTNEVVLSADDVRIFMGAGNDEARVDGFVPGFVHIEGGAGNDRLSLGDPLVLGTARLDGARAAACSPLP